jgi:acetyl-CoA C-acetyltransferase
MTEIVIAGSARTAVGAYGGGLKDTPAAELATAVAKAALERAGVAPADIDHVVLGNVMHTAMEDPYLPRVAGVGAGIPVSSPAMAVNRLCGSGVEAVLTAARLILAGDAQVVLAGGVEAMSRGPYWLTKARWGQRLGHDQLLDSVQAGISDPFHRYPMGMTAENVATKYGISRERQDAWSLQSQERAAAAIADGRFAAQIVPIPLSGRRGEPACFEVDEHPRATSAEKLAALRPIFKDGGSVTAGNASGLNDGAAAMIVTTAARARELGITPQARLAAWAVTGCEPEIMGIGPIQAVQKVLAKAGLSLNQIDLIELNEAFAAQVLAVMDALELDPAKTNPNGGAIALGHPIGATGAVLLTKLVHELHRAGGQRGIVTACIGGGQGVAAVLERV